MKKLSLILLCLVLCASMLITNASAESDDGIENMIPAFDSVMRAMMYSETKYDPLDPEFFWEAIYLMAVNFDLGDYDADSAYDDDTYELLLSTLAVREMAVALFSEYNGLLPIPDTFAYMVKYDDELNVYRFPLSDPGDTYVKIDRYELSLSNYVFTVYASMLSGGEDEALISAKFELMPNTDSGDIIIRYYPYSIVSAEIISNEEPGDNVFGLIDGGTFNFLSGAGGWSTEVVMSGDGSFTGQHHDWDMGDIDDDYPNGTYYECNFSGVFTVTGKVDEYTYELRLVSLNLEEEAGLERIEDGVRIINSSAYGIEGGEVFMLYCPGIATADLPENFLWWIRAPHAWEDIPEKLPFYGLYNTKEELGFFMDLE